MSIINLVNTKHFPSVALAAAGVKKNQWYAVLFKIAGDDHCRPYLRSKLKTHALYLRSKHSITITRKALFNLVELCLAEFRNPLHVEDKDSHRARILEVGESTFDRKFKKMYDELYLEINEWASRGESKIKANFNMEDFKEELESHQSYDADHDGYVNEDPYEPDMSKKIDEDYNG